MKHKIKFAFLILFTLGIVLLLAHLLEGRSVAVFDPKGMIGLKERDLIITAALLMLIVVIPVYILIFTIAWKYRASNTKATYTPDWQNNKMLEIIWWAIPTVIIIFLAMITWSSSHELDPFRAIDATTKPITIQVVALDWKWLFIYPEQHIATVNIVEFPAHTPVNFEITADAPMNSFWIPQLGGQIYAMAGMKTQLHLIADEIGTYNGVSANFSGAGFSGMKFVAHASSQSDFDQWVADVKQSPVTLSADGYAQLAKPSEHDPSAYYSEVEDNLYDKIVMKFMKPQSTTTIGAIGNMEDHMPGSN